MDNGWIKLHRKLLSNPLVMKDGDHLAIWTWLLLSVTHDGVDVMFEGKRTHLEPGQITTGRKRISEVLRVSESKVQRVLDMFESEQQIEQRTDRQCRLITVLKWKDYQVTEQRNERPLNNERTTTEQRLNTKQECKNEKNEIMKETDSDSEAALIAPTPSQEAVTFFADSVAQENCSAYMATKGIDRIISDREIAKFVRYWTEPTKNGKKQRWELEKTFEVKRRLVTWFGNLNKSAPHFNSQQKGMVL